MPVIDLVPLKQVRETLGVTRMTLYRWVKEGKLSVVRLSRQKVYVRREELERFVRESEK
jgi:excisionase family DNA binding protein